MCQVPPRLLARRDVRTTGLLSVSVPITISPQRVPSHSAYPTHTSERGNTRFTRLLPALHPGTLWVVVLEQHGVIHSQPSSASHSRRRRPRISPLRASGTRRRSPPLTRSHFSQQLRRAGAIQFRVDSRGLATRVRLGNRRLRWGQIGQFTSVHSRNGSSLQFISAARTRTASCAAAASTPTTSTPTVHSPASSAGADAVHSTAPARRGSSITLSSAFTHYPCDTPHFGDSLTPIFAKGCCRVCVPLTAPHYCPRCCLRLLVRVLRVWMEAQEPSSPLA